MAAVDLDDKVAAALKELEGPPCRGCGGELRLSEVIADQRHRDDCPVKVVREELERLQEREDAAYDSHLERDLYD